MSERKESMGIAVQEVDTVVTERADEGKAGEWTKEEGVGEGVVGNEEGAPPSVPASTCTSDSEHMPPRLNGPCPSLRPVAVIAVAAPFVLYFFVVGPLMAWTGREVSDVLRFFAPWVEVVATVAQHTSNPYIAIALVAAITISFVAFMRDGHRTLDNAIEMVPEIIRHLSDLLDGDKRSDKEGNKK